MDATARTFRYLERRRSQRAAQGGGGAEDQPAAQEMKRLLASLFAVAAGALLGGCGGDEHRRAAGRSSPRRPRISAASVDAAAAGEALRAGAVHRRGHDRSVPPGAHRSRAARTAPRTSTRKLAEQENRIKEPLEAFPLESIQMLGTITQDKETFALVKAGPNLYRVRKGNYMGQNFGVITVDRRECRST